MLCLRLFLVIILDGPSAPKFKAETLVVSENAGEDARGGVGVLLFGEIACERNDRAEGIAEKKWYENSNATDSQ